MARESKIENVVKEPFREAVQDFVASDTFGRLVELSRQHDLVSNDGERFRLSTLVDALFAVAGGSNESIQVNIVARASRILGDLASSNYEHRNLINDVRDTYQEQVSANETLSNVLGGAITEARPVSDARSRNQ